MIVVNSCHFIYDLNRLDNKFCGISGEPFYQRDCDTKNILQLECGHIFKYRPFMRSYRILNQNIYTRKRCPYCMNTISKVPIVINIKDLKRLRTPKYILK